MNNTYYSNFKPFADGYGLDLNVGGQFRIAAAGDKQNDKVARCKICNSNGFPHGPIDFQRIQGRMHADGTRETIG
jgi:hypothetical protein